MEGKTFAWLDKFCDWLESLLKALLMISVALLAAVLLIGVASRYVLPTPVVGMDEAAMFLLVWVTFLGTSIGIKKNDMVAVTVFVERLGTLKKVLQFVVQVLALLFSILFLYYGYKWTFAPSTLNTSSVSLQIPLWLVYVIFPFSMLTTAIFALHNILLLFSPWFSRSNDMGIQS